MPRRKVSFSNGEGGGREVLEACETKDLARFPRRATEREITTTPLSLPLPSALLERFSPRLTHSSVQQPVFSSFRKRRTRRRRADFCQLRPSAFIADPPFTKRRMDVSLVAMPSRRGGREIFFFRDSIDRLNLKNNLLYYKRGSMKINNPC